MTAELRDLLVSNRRGANQLQSILLLCIGGVERCVALMPLATIARAHINL